MPRLRMLDLYCGAGGCSMGYHRAGFDVTGVDVEPQPRCPFGFVRADALEYLAAHGHEFDTISASPPCQHYSRCAGIPGRVREEYPDLLPLTRALLVASGRPWLMENVDSAPMRAVMLCGQMFGLGVFRHRLFESSAALFTPPHPKHRKRIKPVGGGKTLANYGNLDRDGVVTVAGHLFGLADGRRAMGIDWMNRAELAEAIPPAYTEYLGRQLLTLLEA